MKILLAEDDSKLLRHLAAGLREAGHTVDCAHDGAEARWAVENGAHEVLVLDIMMPQLDGVTLVRALRRRGLGVPILFITARGEVRDRVSGLDAGADDYLVKPFSLDELLARLRALGRRQRGGLSHTLRVGDLEMDLVSRTVKRGERLIELTNREFALLEFLAHAPRGIFLGATAISLPSAWTSQTHPIPRESFVDLGLGGTDRSGSSLRKPDLIRVLQARWSFVIAPLPQTGIMV